MSEQEKKEEPKAANTELVKKARSTARKKKIRRLIIWLIILALLGAGGYFAYQKFFKKQEAQSEALTDFVTVGSITSKVEGSGLTKAKESQTVSLSTPGTVMQLFVEEGQQVFAGDPLYSIDSPTAETAVQSAKAKVERYQKQLDEIYESLSGLNLAPSFSGKLLDTVKLQPGDEITRGMKVATIVDDKTMMLTQYYSYAYEHDIKVGQEFMVSVPALMTAVSGKVSDIHYVSRVSEEGSKLFSVEIAVQNPGSLTEGMAASASAIINGEDIFPYEAGTLEYSKTADLTSTVNGKVVSSELYDYLDVKKGQVLLRISGDESDSEIFDTQQLIDSANEELEKAQKNLENCQGFAPIDGMIIGLSIREGDTVNANDQILTISDTNRVMISANVDERNISFVKVGMPVTLDQWGNMAFGTVENVSMSSTINNGAASYPIVIAADNYDGVLQLNSYVSYSIDASRSDNCLLIPLQSVYNVLLADESEASVVYVRAESAPEETAELMDMSSVPEGFVPVVVEIGLSDSYNVEIKSGLEEGMEVFTQMVASEVWN